MPHNGFNGGQTDPPQLTTIMIATAFTDLSSNDLWVEIDWLQEQPSTPATRKAIRAMWTELETRQQRRQYLVEHFC